MPSLAWRGIQLARPRSAVTPNSGAVARSKEAQKVTPCKNYLAETKPPTDFFARQGVSPSGSQSETLFLFRSLHQPGRLPFENPPRTASRSAFSRSCHRWTVRFVPIPSVFPAPTPMDISSFHKPDILTLPRHSDSRRFTCQPASPKISRPGAKLPLWDEAYKPRP